MTYDPSSAILPVSPARPGHPARSMRPLTRRTLTAATISLLVALAVAGCSSSATTPTPASPAPSSPTGSVTALPAEVSVQEASAMQAAGAFMLDVREPDEWAAGHIPGATLIPLGELANRTSEVPADRKVVVVCRSGNRSAQGRDILLGAGFASVTSMAGGMNDWTAAGLPTEQGS
jgi:rhodanese-related sulfurtransferase